MEITIEVTKQDYKNDDPTYELKILQTINSYTLFNELDVEETIKAIKDTLCVTTNIGYNGGINVIKNYD